MKGAEMPEPDKPHPEQGQIGENPLVRARWSVSFSVKITEKTPG